MTKSSKKTSTKKRSKPKQPKKLQRPQRKRLLAGVCAGFADRYNLNVDTIRLIFTILTFIGGISIIIYLTLWLLIPEQ